MEGRSTGAGRASPRQLHQRSRSLPEGAGPVSPRRQPPVCAGDGRAEQSTVLLFRAGPSGNRLFPVWIGLHPGAHSGRPVSSARGGPRSMGDELRVDRPYDARHSTAQLRRQTAGSGGRARKTNTDPSIRIVERRSVVRCVQPGSRRGKSQAGRPRAGCSTEGQPVPGDRVLLPRRLPAGRDRGAKEVAKHRGRNRTESLCIDRRQVAAPAVPARRRGNLRERRVQVPAHLEWGRDGLWSQLWRGANRAACFSRHLLDLAGQMEGRGMRKNLMFAFVLIVSLAVSTMFSNAQDSSGAPHLRKQGTATQLIVDGKPFLALAGELGNNSATSLENMEPVWSKIVAGNLNTALIGISWAQFEPKEGKFDYTLVDGLIAKARENNLHIIFLWFASWKNGTSSFAPIWVKRDYQRFPRIQINNGSTVSISGPVELLSTLGSATRDADAAAFGALMRGID